MYLADLPSLEHYLLVKNSPPLVRLAVNPSGRNRGIYRNGYGGNDHIEGSTGDDALFGGSGKDQLRGEEGNDKMYGGSDNDTLWGDSGIDRLDGGTGHDQLHGGLGDDSLIDADGGDRLTGDKGSDTFVLGTGQLGHTLITDFEVSSDKVKFQQLGLTQHDLKIREHGQGTMISVNGRELVQLLNIEPTQLTARNFEFGDPEIARRLKTLTQRSILKTLSPGAVLSVTTKTGETWTGATGVADLQTKQAMKPSDHFQIGSITKSFTATVIMQLFQEHKLSLNDKLGQWLPNVTLIIPNANRITLRQMLTHTSGIPDYTTVPAYLEAIKTDPTKNWSSLEVLNLIKNVAPTNPPGKSQSYSNTNYYLLGLIIEKISGSTYAYEIRSRILKPLGMENTFVGAQEKIPGGFVQGYNDINGDGKINAKKENVKKVSLSSFGAAGNIVSNVADLTRFGEALFSGELVAPDILKLMETPGIKGSFYGLGIFQSPVPGQSGWWGHNGATFGNSSSLYSDPLTGATYVTLENSDSGAFGSKSEKGYDYAANGS